MKALPPAPRPCESCPFRRDVPSGIWAPVEYDKLRDYDRPFIEQPPVAFQCHQTDRGSDKVRICGGWAGTFNGKEMLALRLAVPRGQMTLEVLHAVLDYTTDVELFETGEEAAEHGMEDVLWPSEEADRMIEKIMKVRTDLIVEDQP